MSEDGIPVRSPEGRAAEHIFYDFYNDVHIFVEDEELENLYFEILRKVIPGVRIESIFPLNGKPNVLAHARDPQNATYAHKFIYILDKDFDDLLGRVVAADNIFYLDRYSVENFLLEPDALTELAVECEPRRKRETLRRELSWSERLRGAITDLRGLMGVYVVVQRMGISVETCKLNVQRFCCETRPWEVDAKKIQDFKEEVCRLAIARGLVRSQQEFDAAARVAIPSTGPRDANICGKYLLGIAYNLLRAKVRAGTLTLDSFAYRMAKHCEFDSLANLGARIQERAARLAARQHRGH